MATPSDLPNKPAKRGRSRLFRTDVRTTLAQQPLDRTAAESRLNLERGAFNVSPWGFTLGVVGALLSLLFALHAALDARQAQRDRAEPRVSPVTESAPPGNPAPAPTWIDVEVE